MIPTGWPHTPPMRRAPTLHIAQVVSTSRHAGIENYVAMVAQELCTRGHAVTVVSQLDPRVFLGPGPRGVHVRDWRDAIKWLRSGHRMDVVHSHTTLADVAAVWGCRGAPVMSTRHFARARWSDEDGQGRSWLQPAGWTGRILPDVVRRWLRERIDRGVTWEVAIGDFVASCMPRCDEVIRTGVPNRGDLAPVAERPRRVITLQRLEEVKQTQVAIEAWALASASRRGWRLELHGEGRLREHLIREVSRLGLEGSVTVPGRCNEPAALLAETALLLAPSVAEPFGLTVLEAMASGVPVIATASGGHLESLGAVPGAALFPVGDATACARLLDHLTSDPAALARLSHAQLDVQRTRFSIATMVDRLETTYARLASRTRVLAADINRADVHGRTS